MQRTTSKMQIVIPPGLQLVYRKFKDYDVFAEQKKAEFKQRRQFIIILILMSSGSVLFLSLMSLFTDTFEFLSPVINIIGVLVFTMPIILPRLARLLMDNDQNPTTISSTTAWVKFRYNAERIRSEMYLYTMRAGKYGDSNRDSNLEQTITEIDNVKDYFPGLREQPEDLDREMREFIVTKIEDYKAKRIKEQKEWYERRIRSDYYNSIRHQNWILVISITGLLVGAFVGLGQWQMGVGITALITIFGLALDSWAKINMIGSTFGIYSQFYKKLELYEAFQLPHKQSDQEVVDDIEKILMEELEIWYQTALEMQTQVTASIEQLLNKDKN